MGDIIISDIPRYRAGREIGHRNGIDGEPHATARPHHVSESYLAGWEADAEQAEQPEHSHQSRHTRRSSSTATGIGGQSVGGCSTAHPAGGYARRASERAAGLGH